MHTILDIQTIYQAIDCQLSQLCIVHVLDTQNFSRSFALVMVSGLHNADSGWFSSCCLAGLNCSFWRLPINATKDDWLAGNFSTCFSFLDTDLAPCMDFAVYFPHLCSLTRYVSHTPSSSTIYSYELMLVSLIPRPSILNMHAREEGPVNHIQAGFEFH